MPNDALHLGSERRAIVVAIDGPAGAGKSTAARRLAKALDFTYIDTGAMYRSVGLLATEQGIDLGDAPALEALVGTLEFSFPWIDGSLHTRVGGRDVSRAIRTEEASMNASTVSKVGEVRTALVALQRAMGRSGAVVMEGRDIGTVVFPDAELKIFLTASARVRGKRRWQELKERGEDAALEAVIAEVERRDLQDSTREIAPLKPAADSVVLDSSDLGLDEVHAQLLLLADQRSE